MRLQKEFGGDYATEFGGESRKWSKHLIIHNSGIVGVCWQEPPTYAKPYRAYTVKDDYIGSFATRKEMYAAILAAGMEPIAS